MRFLVTILLKIWAISTVNPRQGEQLKDWIQRKCWI